jgi:hypothetical protein
MCKRRPLVDALLSTLLCLYYMLSLFSSLSLLHALLSSLPFPLFSSLLFSSLLCLYLMPLYPLTKLSDACLPSKLQPPNLNRHLVKAVCVIVEREGV